MLDISKVLFLGLSAYRYVDNKLSYSVLLLAVVLLYLSYGWISLLLLPLGLLGLSIGFLTLQASTILLGYASGGDPQPGVAPLIPGLQIGPFYIPFVEGWLSLFLILLIHEGAHGIASLRRGIPVRDWGVVFLVVLPIGAFVSPDEERYKNATRDTKLTILSAGAGFNMLAFMLSSVLLVSLLFATSPYVEHVVETYGIGLRVGEVPPVVEINGKQLKSLVYGVMEGGDIITHVNGVPVKTVDDLKKAMGEGNAVTIRFFRGEEFREVTIPNKGYIGVKGLYTELRDPPLLYSVLVFIISFLSVFAMLNFLIAVVNALPFFIFDGGQVVKEVYPHWKWLNTVAKALLLINILPWFI